MTKKKSSTHFYVSVLTLILLLTFIYGVIYGISQLRDQIIPNLFEQVNMFINDILSYVKKACNISVRDIYDLEENDLN